MKKLIRSNRAFTAFTIISVIVIAAGLIIGNELIYMLLGQYLILSVSGLICSACAAKKGKFLHPVIFTVIASLLPFIILGKTDIVFVAFAGAPCALGLIIGAFAFLISKAIKKNKKAAEQENEEGDADTDTDTEAEAEEEISVEAEDVNASEANAPEQEEVEEAEETLTEAE